MFSLNGNQSRASQLTSFYQYGRLTESNENKMVHPKLYVIMKNETSSCVGIL